MLLLTFLTVLVIYCGVWFAKNVPRPPNYPPGPKGLFSFLQLAKIDRVYPFRAMLQLSRQYGGIVGLTLLHRRMICVSSYEAVKEVLSNDKLQGRPNLFTFNMRTSGKQLGLLTSQGELWKEHRRFTIRHLRDFGFGKTSLESIMHEEINDLVSELSTSIKDSQGKNVLLNGFFTISVVNVLWTMVAGTRFQRNDPKFHVLMEVIEEFFRASSGIPNIVALIPQVRFIAPEKTGYNKLKRITKVLRSFIGETIREHLKTLPVDESRDLLDVYLQEMQKQADNPNSTFDIEQIYGVVLDIFTAGAETTSNLLGFALLYMIFYPEVQEKIHREIDSVCQGRLPTVSDKAKLPYVEATIAELHRITGVAPLTIPHVASGDTTVMGYAIPKDSTVFVNLYGVHMNEDVWPDPEKFQPERHLDPSGRFVKHDHVMPFGGGKRSCMGEALAKNSLFYFFTGIMQKFRFSMPAGDLDSVYRPVLEPLSGFSLAPKPYMACVEERI